MSLPAGTRLGPYEVLAPLKGGGMGEVYRARDSRLRRDVALKVILPRFAHDPGSVERFEQEARAAGTLAHPNVVSIHDVGVHDGVPFLVMELLEGETLRERLRAGPLPVRKAIDYTTQVAHGLTAAHQKGILHRDLKPENLWVTQDGRVKILDFGLAKLSRPEVTTDSDTVSIALTESGVLLGTPGYMAPEQFRGDRADDRSDLFALGAILYELLTGKRAFHGASRVETEYAILHEEPAPLSASGRDIPPGLETVVRRCLEKEPGHRFESAHDLALALEVAAAGSHAASQPLPPPVAERRMLALIGLALVVGTAVLTNVLSRRAAPPPSPVHQVRPLTTLGGLEESSAISPDGKMVAFTVLKGRNRQIFIRYLVDSPTRPVTTDDADHDAPRWLPNGSALVYFSPAGPEEMQGAIYRIPALGGPPQRVTASIGGGDVSHDGRLACFRLEGERIQLVTMSLEGQVVTRIADLPTQHYSYPRWSPDGQKIAFQQGDGFRWDVHVVAAVAGSKPAAITRENKAIRGFAWLPDGSGILYATSRASSFPYLPPLSLWEARLDGRQRQLTSPDASYEQPDLHANGLVSVTRLRMRYDLWAYPFDGAVSALERGRQVTRQTGQVSTPTVSPDGREVAYLSDDGGHANVWITSGTGSARQITFENDPSVAIGVPAWSPDGKWIAYLSSKGNLGLGFGIWLVSPDGSENHKLVSKGLSPAWSADGRWIYYVEASNTPIMRISADGGVPESIRTEPARNVIGVQGSTMYYVVDRATTDGRQQFEIRAARPAGGPARTIVTIPVSRVPPWQIANPTLSPDGRWLAMPLTDGFTTNIWAISTEDARMRQVTGFGDRAIYIARRVSWSHDGRSILAAIGEGDADIVLLDGLIPGVRR